MSFIHGHTFTHSSTHTHTHTHTHTDHTISVTLHVPKGLLRMACLGEGCGNETEEGGDTPEAEETLTIEGVDADVSTSLAHLKREVMKRALFAARGGADK